MKRLRAFLQGMKEFRCSITTRYEDDGVDVAYEWGRELAHRLSLRHFED